MRISLNYKKALCLGCCMPLMAIAGETQQQSWFGRLSQWVGLSSEQDSNVQIQSKDPGYNKKSDQWQKQSTHVYDFLPDDYPGIRQYRTAVYYQRWAKRPAHDLQQIYDLYEKSVNKGNALAVFGQYDLSQQFPTTDANGKLYMREKLRLACERIYKDAVKANADIQYQYAKYCFKTGSAQANSWYMRAFKQYEQAATRAVPYAQYMLGKIYQAYGEENTAQDWFVIAAQNGYRHAVCEIKPTTFHEKKLWTLLPERLKKENSCATYIALKVIAQTHQDKTVALAAAHLYASMPVGYKDSGFKAENYYFFAIQKNDSAELINQCMKQMKPDQIKTAEALVEKYKNQKVPFIDDYLDRFTWQQINPFN